MSAPEITVFLPAGVDGTAILAAVSEAWSLVRDELPVGFPVEISAQRREVNSYLLVEYSSQIELWVNERLAWEQPSAAYKALIKESIAAIHITYRNIEQARRVLTLIDKIAGDAADRCLVDNDRGCLLILSDIACQLAHDPSWTWERDHFPELPGVTSSEWLDETPEE